MISHGDFSSDKTPGGASQPVLVLAYLIHVLPQPRRVGRVLSSFQHGASLTNQSQKDEKRVASYAHGQRCYF